MMKILLIAAIAVWAWMITLLNVRVEKRLAKYRPWVSKAASFNLLVVGSAVLAYFFCLAESVEGAMGFWLCLAGFTEVGYGMRELHAGIHLHDKKRMENGYTVVISSVVAVVLIIVVLLALAKRF